MLAHVPSILSLIWYLDELYQVMISHKLSFWINIWWTALLNCHLSGWHHIHSSQYKTIQCLATEMLSLVDLNFSNKEAPRNMKERHQKSWQQGKTCKNETNVCQQTCTLFQMCLCVCVFWYAFVVRTTKKSGQTSNLTVLMLVSLRSVHDSGSVTVG